MKSAPRFWASLSIRLTETLSSKVLVMAQDSDQQTKTASEFTQ
jgi:hypothetical protein